MACLGLGPEGGAHHSYPSRNPALAEARKSLWVRAVWRASVCVFVSTDGRQLRSPSEGLQQVSVFVT